MIIPIALIQNFSFGEIAIVAFVLVLLFGAKRLPEFFGSIGRSINEFKRGMHETVSGVGAELEVKERASSTEPSKSA